MRSSSGEDKMTHRINQRLVWIALIALTLILAGCGAPPPPVPPAVPTQTPPPPGIPTDVPTVAAQGEDSGAPDTLDYAGAGLDSLSSYSTTLAMEFTGTNPEGAAASLTLSAQHRYRSEGRGPFSDWQRMEFAASNVATLTGSGVVSLTQIGGAGGVQGFFEAEAGGNPYSCVTLSGDALAAPSASFMTLDSLIPPGALTGMQRVEPNEIVGGIESRHYRAENVAAGEFTSATVDEIGRAHV